MTQIKPRKQRTTFTTEQKLDYAKLMVNENYTNKQIIVYDKRVASHFFTVYPDSMAAITLSGFLLYSAWRIIALSKAELLIGSKKHNTILDHCLCC
jgi:hypothetical protein